MAIPSFSQDEMQLYQELALSFRRFLIYLKFDGSYETAVGLQRVLEKDPVIGKENISSVHMLIAWQLCFGRDIRPLWLTPQANSPVEVIKDIIDRLGVYSPTVQRFDKNILGLDNGNQLNVSPFFSKAGCGLSFTELVMENCPSAETNQEMRQNLCPVLYSVTKGEGRIITIA